MPRAGLEDRGPGDVARQQVGGELDAAKGLDEPARVDVSPKAVTVEKIEQGVLEVGNDRKVKLVAYLIKDTQPIIEPEPVEGIRRRPAVFIVA